MSRILTTPVSSEPCIQACLCWQTAWLYLRPSSTPDTKPSTITWNSRVECLFKSNYYRAERQAFLDLWWLTKHFKDSRHVHCWCVYGWEVPYVILWYSLTSSRPLILNSVHPLIVWFLVAWRCTRSYEIFPPSICPNFQEAHLHISSGRQSAALSRIVNGKFLLQKNISTSSLWFFYVGGPLYSSEIMAEMSRLYSDTVNTTGYSLAWQCLLQPIDVIPC